MPQHQRQALERILVVVGDQDVASHRHRRLALAGIRRRAVALGTSSTNSGSRTVNSLPWSTPGARGADLAAMQFDQRAHQREADAEPAAGRFTRSLGICVNSSKMRGMASAAMPMPVSRTHDLGACRRCARVASTMWPPSPVYLAALCSRLPTTCASRTGSPRTVSSASAASISQLLALLLEQRLHGLHRRGDDRPQFTGSLRPARSCRARCATRRAGRRPGGSCASAAARSRRATR